MFTKALEFAKAAHTGQKRKSGEDFIVHPIEVAKILESWKMDKTTIIAGLLHDTVEDGGATREDIIKEFGEEVALLVEGVTKITKIHLRGSTEEQFVENLRKMILVMAQDLRVVFVKLADRLHNMRTLGHLPSESQLENARETLEIYAPLAERMGMGEVKGQLEDLAFPYVYPKEYKELMVATKELFAKGEIYIKKFKDSLDKLLLPRIHLVIVNTRHKHLYSLFKKLQRPEIKNDISKINDLVAARILVDTTEECYIALGLIHGKYHPIPYLGMRDYIANPKPNGYRSIHINVFGPEGRTIELQIRTKQMHEQAEMGVASHWQMADLKSKGKLSSEDIDKGIFSTDLSKLSWVKQLTSWQTEIVDSEEYLRAVKFDGLQHRNLVFSPKGDVYDLPRDATPIDYAYAVHGQVGHQTKSAKVNGRLVSLNAKLKNGDVVEILTDRNHKTPSANWLEFAVTNKARYAIARALKAV